MYIVCGLNDTAHCDMAQDVKQMYNDSAIGKTI